MWLSNMCAEFLFAITKYCRIVCPFSGDGISRTLCPVPSTPLTNDQIDGHARMARRCVSLSGRRNATVNRDILLQAKEGKEDGHKHFVSNNSGVSSWTHQVPVEWTILHGDSLRNNKRGF